MLDLIKLVPQIQEMTRRVVAAGPGLEERRAAAEQRLRETAAAPERFARLSRDRSEPRMALPTHEPIDASFAAPPRPGSVTVMAVDGSQIEPDFHEISACYVINVGAAVFHYEPSPAPGSASLTSEPRLYFRREEMEPEEQSEVRFGTWEDLDAARMLAESGRLAELLEAATERWGDGATEGDGETGGPRRPGRPGDGAKRPVPVPPPVASVSPSPRRPGRPVAAPVVAFLDGPLIAWRLGWIEPRSRREEAARNFLLALDAGREARAPVAGYLSRTRSTDLIHLLRFACCETAVATGDFCPRCRAAWRPDGVLPAGAEAPCFAPIEGLIDTDLIGTLCPRPGQRSAVFESNSSVLAQLYAEHRRIGFFFLNAGFEIARVEVPEWVWQDPATLEMVHAVVYDQIRLGKGYPIALSEAHEQAVVRAPERHAFFDLLRRSQTREGMWAEISAKAQRKRGPIA